MTYQQAKNNLPEYITEQVFNKLVAMFSKHGINSYSIERGVLLFHVGNGNIFNVSFDSVKKNESFILSYT
jgi:hypothetical protein